MWAREKQVIVGILKYVLGVLYFVHAVSGNRFHGGCGIEVIVSRLSWPRSWKCLMVDFYVFCYEDNCVKMRGWVALYSRITSLHQDSTKGAR